MTVVDCLAMGKKKQAIVEESNERTTEPKAPATPVIPPPSEQRYPGHRGFFRLSADGTDEWVPDPDDEPAPAEPEHTPEAPQRPVVQRTGLAGPQVARMVAERERQEAVAVAAEAERNAQQQARRVISRTRPAKTVETEPEDGRYPGASMVFNAAMESHQQLVKLELRRDELIRDRSDMFESLLRRREYTLDQLSEIFGINRSTLYKMVKDFRDAKAKKSEKISAIV